MEASLPPKPLWKCVGLPRADEEGWLRESCANPPCGSGAPRAAPCVRTFLDDVDDVIGVEAELVGVLRVVGVERPALRHLRLGLGLRLGPPSGRGRAA